MPKEMASPVEAILGQRFQMCIDLGTWLCWQPGSMGVYPAGGWQWSHNGRIVHRTAQGGRTGREVNRSPGQARAARASSSETKRYRCLVR